VVPDVDRQYEIEYICKICGEHSVARSSVKGGRRDFCDSCRPAAAKDAQARKNLARNVQNDPNARRRNNIANLRKYGLTVEQHEAMMLAQGNVCAICGEAANPDGVRAASRLHVDHNHVTGKVRGLLCNHCNRGLGFFRDSRELIEAAVAYLRVYET
jgi:Recombination endonuclease VII